MARTIWKAVKLDMIITIAPTIWSRLGKLWQKYTIPARMPRGQVFKRVKDLFFFQLHQWQPIRAVQQMIYQNYGYKIRVATLKYWIIRRKYGREPDGETTSDSRYLRRSRGSTREIIYPYY